MGKRKRGKSGVQHIKRLGGNGSNGSDYGPKGKGGGLEEFCDDHDGKGGDKRSDISDYKQFLRDVVKETSSDKSKRQITHHEDLIIRKAERILEDLEEIAYHNKKLKHRNKKLLSGDMLEESTVYTRIGDELIQGMMEGLSCVRHNFGIHKKRCTNAKLWKQKPGTT